QIRQGRRAGDASRPDEPRRRNRLGNRRWSTKRDPGPGGNGRCRPHGGDGSAARPAPFGCRRCSMSVTVFHNARIVDPSRNLDETGTVIIDGTVIVAAGAGARNQGTPEGATVIDCTGKAILPGLVDARVHI